MSKHTQKDQGFSLMEMLVVLVFIGLLAGIAGPVIFGGGEKSTLRTATEDIKSMALRSSLQAKKQSRPIDLWIDVTKKTIWHDQTHIHLEKLDQISLTTAQKLKQTDDVGRIIFFPDGTTTGGKITLHLQKRQRIVNIDWLSTEVTIQDAS